MSPHGPCFYDDSGDASFGVPADGTSGWEQNQTWEFLRPDLNHDYNHMSEDHQLLQGGSAVLHRQTPLTAYLYPLSAANHSDVQSWSGLHLHGDEHAIASESNGGYIIIQEEVSETTRSLCASSNTFSFFDDTSKLASFSASEQYVDGPAGTYNVDQSMLTATPWNTDRSARWTNPANHADLQGHDEQLGSELLQPNLRDDASDLGEHYVWNSSRDEQTE